MRGGVLAAGIALFVVGVLLFVPASVFNAGAAACAANFGCSGGDAAARSMAAGFTTGAILFALAGVGLGIAGAVMPDKTRTLVPTAPTPPRACPACSALLASDARFCSQCGATVAPTR